MKQILLVEDNPGDARLVKELLAECSDFDIHITCVERVSDASEMLSKQTIDLIFLDLYLPDSQGLEGLRQLTSISPNVPIIVLTGMYDTTLALAALKHGARDFLVKDTLNAELLRRVMRHA